MTKLCIPERALKAVQKPTPWCLPGASPVGTGTTGTLVLSSGGQHLIAHTVLDLACAWHGQEQQRPQVPGLGGTAWGKAGPGPT